MTDVLGETPNLADIRAGGPHYRIHARPSLPPPPPPPGVVDAHCTLSKVAMIAGVATPLFKAGTSVSLQPQPDMSTWETGWISPADPCRSWRPALPSACRSSRCLVRRRSDHAWSLTQTSRRHTAPDRSPCGITNPRS